LALPVLGIVRCRLAAGEAYGRLAEILDAIESKAIEWVFRR